uniref:SCP domain-containing protein n=1 Tax=Solanum lycopersicum TaxID=4081 RepID=A0A3Q7IG09_SOLLC
MLMWNKQKKSVGVGPLTWHDKVCNLVHSQGQYGENLAASTGDFITATKAVEMWVNEKQYYHHEPNTCNSVCLGCARVQCNKGAYVLCCNYDPPGNFIGQTPY